MTDLPEPLVPPECNMAGNDWFPLYFQRLRKSKWWRRASDLARARNVMLWGEAYQATPAGSLPNDDDDLAEAAGFGMDVDGFLAVKEEIMAPWVLCADGRWYHPTTCEVVLEAWEKVGERRKKEATKKAAQRAKVREGTTKTVNVPAKAVDVPRDNRNVPGDIPPKMLLSPSAPAQTEQTEQDREENTDASASLSLGLGEPEAKSPKYPADFEAVWRAYPHFPGRSSKKATFGIWRRLTPARRIALPSAIARYAREGREPKADCGAPAMERWLTRELDLNWAGPEPTSSNAAAAPDSDTKWRRWLREFRQNRYWPEADAGPRPGRAGCRVPAALLVEFGFPASEAGAEVLPFPEAAERRQA